MSDLCLKNDEYTMCRGACSFEWLMSDLCLKNDEYTMCRGACSFEWLMSDLCLQNEAYTVCRALIPSSGSCRIFAVLNL